jgi:VWFA-related protein
VFTRAVLINVKPGCEVELTRTLEQEVVPLFRRERDFRGLIAFILRDGTEALSLSLWDQKESAGGIWARCFDALMALARVALGIPSVQIYEVSNSTFHAMEQTIGRVDTPFTDQTAQLQVALSRITANGETALYDAVAAALEHLKKGNRDKKVLIVVSDGGDNASKHNLAQIMAMAGQSDAIIYTIGIYSEEDPDQNPNALRQLSRATGGEAFFPQSVAEVVPLCERIAHDIRNQYTIAYSPANRTQDGAYRGIQVKAMAPGHGRLSVRTRAGYYAPSKPQPLAPIAASQTNRP